MHSHMRTHTCTVISIPPSAAHARPHTHTQTRIGWPCAVHQRRQQPLIKVMYVFPSDDCADTLQLKYVAFTLERMHNSCH